MLVNYKLQNIFRCGEFRLIPGRNEVDAAKWNKALPLYPKLRLLIDDGMVETFDKTGRARDEEETAKPVTASTPVMDAMDLTKIAEKKAVKIVKETVDVVLLEKWHLAEKRHSVLKAIESQFEAIAQSGEGEDDKAKTDGDAE